MSKKNTSLEEKLEWLAEEILVVKENLSDLNSRITSLESGRVPIMSASSQGRSEQAKEQPPEGMIEIPEEDGWTWVSQEVLLPRVAAVSFMLVVALILRTVTDNGMVDMVLGSYMGTLYAVGLIGAGWFLYAKQSKLAPVFPACGVLLLYSIIFETYVRFESISATTVYTILLAAATITVIIGLRCRAGVLLYLATFGSTLVGGAIGFPKPLFVCLALVLLINNLAGHLASRRGITTKLRWWTLFFSIIFWMLWAYKLNFALRFSGTAMEMGLTWSMPLLLLFYALNMYTSLWKTLTEGMELEVFHNILPVINAGGCFFAAYVILGPWQGWYREVGWAGVAVSALYIGLVTWLAKRSDDDVPGGKEFVTAATILLIQGLAVSLDSIWALPIWTAAAAILTLRAASWRSGGIRVISYLFQLFIFLYALKNGMFNPKFTAWPVGLMLLALISLTCLWLYRWCRANPPDYDSAFFTLFDRKDRTAVILLILGLFHGFFFFRFGLHGLLQKMMDEAANSYFCGQSILINLGVVALMITGLKLRNREMLILAIPMVLIAALKVFIFDLFKAQGMPLVLSVFSFGIVAAAASMTLKKWQSVKKEIREEEPIEEAIPSNVEAASP